MMCDRHTWHQVGTCLVLTSDKLSCQNPSYLSERKVEAQKGDVTPSGYRDPLTELDVGESPQGSHGTGTGDLQTSWGASLNSH